ncbi:MAG TPA: hypothetical protein VGB38_09685, partial [bacterium]
MKSKSILFSILLTALFLSTVSAQVGENMNLIGRWGMGTCKAVSVYGSYLLMGNGATLDIWEVNGIRPYLTKKGQVNLPGVVSDITVAWPKAYLACEDMGLVIVDLSTISNPVLYGPFSTGGKAVAVSIYGEYAYIANGNQGMAVFNIGNVNFPVKTASFETDGEVLDVWADENIVYLAAGSAGFWTVNVTNHYAPARLDSIHIAGTIKSVYIQRSTAYLASGSGGLNLVSIANPSGLSITGHWTTGGTMDATDVAVQKSTAYLTDARFGVRVIDVSAAPQSVWNISTRGAATRITLNQRSYAFVAQDGTGMLLLDAFGTTPLRVDSLETGDQSKDVLFYGNTVYVAGGKSGLWVLNRSQGSLSVASRISSGMIDCQGLARKDTLLFAADGPGGLKVFNVRHPSEPVRLATQPVLSWAAGVGVYGNQVVVADGTSGLHLFGISNPREPSDLAVISLGSNTVRSVTVNAQRNLAFAATNAGTKVVDLQNRILLSTCPGSNDAYASDFSENGNTLYVADGANGIMGFDVSNALVPRLLEALYYDTDGTASDILVKGNAAIVADGEGTVRIVDMTSAPRQVGYYHSAGSSMGLSLSQDTLAVADGEAGVYLFKGNFAGTL